MIFPDPLVDALGDDFDCGLFPLPERTGHADDGSHEYAEEPKHACSECGYATDSEGLFVDHLYEKHGIWGDRRRGDR